MAGPGSRLEKVGTIFSRVQGMLRSGALKDSEKPIWYEVYAKFPPKDNPAVDDEKSIAAPPNLLYKEDLVRAKFYKTYGNPGALDMRQAGIPSISQRFIDSYFEIRATRSAGSGDIFEAAAEALRSEGIRLRTLEEIEKEKQASLARRLEEASLAREAADRQKEAFGEVTPSDEAQDTLDEDIINPDYEQWTKEK